jgi:hypothetical protein
MDEDHNYVFHLCSTPKPTAFGKFGELQCEELLCSLRIVEVTLSLSSR